MKLKKRKIKYAAIFCLCWFVFLVILVDGVLKFQTLVDYFGSYALVEITLLLLVILPTLAVYRLTEEDKTMSQRDFILLLAICFAFALDASDSLPFRYCSMINPAIGAARSAPNPPCST